MFASAHSKGFCLLDLPRADEQLRHRRGRRLVWTGQEQGVSSALATRRLASLLRASKGRGAERSLGQNMRNASRLLVGLDLLGDCILAQRLATGCG